MSDAGNGKKFSKRVMAAVPGGEALITCLQCGTCGGSCPSGQDMDATPRKLFAMIQAEMENEVLTSNTPWYCVSCYYCTVRCPQQIPVTATMYALKRMAIAQGHYHHDNHVDWSNSFIGFIEQNGRAFELGLMTRHYLTHKPLSAVSQGPLGIQMLQKGRLSLRPERIRNTSQLSAILNEAKRIAVEEEVI